jgi:hypothetical protein
MYLICAIENTSRNTYKKYLLYVVKIMPVERIIKIGIMLKTYRLVKKLKAPIKE